jgi:hypothetical protein
VIPITGNTSSATSAATRIITACTTAFLTQALAANIDLAALERLPTVCNFTGEVVMMWL